MKNILITTEWRGVFFAQIDENADLTPRTLTNLKNCRMVIQFGTTRGLMQLCQSGPTERTTLSDPADIDVAHGITAVFSVSDDAAKKFLS